MAQARASLRTMVAAKAAAPVARQSAPITAKTTQGLMPRSSSRWWMCWRSAVSKRRPVNCRRTRANTVSNMGNVMTTRGAVIDSVAEILSVLWIPRIPYDQANHHAPRIAQERSVRGGRLWGRNPASEPARTIATTIT